MTIKLFFIFLLTFSIQQAYSQILISLLFGDKLNSEKLEFGLDGGFNFSQMSNFESSKPLTTFNLGFYFDILLKDQWYINTGLRITYLSMQDLNLLFGPKHDYNLREKRTIKP